MATVGSANAPYFQHDALQLSVNNASMSIDENSPAFAREVFTATTIRFIDKPELLASGVYARTYKLRLLLESDRQLLKNSQPTRASIPRPAGWVTMWPLEARKR